MNIYAQFVFDRRRDVLPPSDEQSLAPWREGEAWLLYHMMEAWLECAFAAVLELELGDDRPFLARLGHPSTIQPSVHLDHDGAWESTPDALGWFAPLRRALLIDLDGPILGASNAEHTRALAACRAVHQARAQVGHRLLGDLKAGGDNEARYIEARSLFTAEYRTELRALINRWRVSKPMLIPLLEAAIDALGEAQAALDELETQRAVVSIPSRVLVSNVARRTVCSGLAPSLGVVPVALGAGHSMALLRPVPRSEPSALTGQLTLPLAFQPGWAQDGQLLSAPLGEAWRLAMICSAACELQSNYGWAKATLYELTGFASPGIERRIFRADLQRTLVELSALESVRLAIPDEHGKMMMRKLFLFADMPTQGERADVISWRANPELRELIGGATFIELGKLLRLPRGTKQARLAAWLYSILAPLWSARLNAQVSTSYPELAEMAGWRSANPTPQDVRADKRAIMRALDDLADLDLVRVAKNGRKLSISPSQQWLSAREQNTRKRLKG